MYYDRVPHALNRRDWKMVDAFTFVGYLSIYLSIQMIQYRPLLDTNFSVLDENISPIKMIENALGLIVDISWYVTARSIKHATYSRFFLWHEMTNKYWESGDMTINLPLTYHQHTINLPLIYHWSSSITIKHSQSAIQHHQSTVKLPSSYR